MLRGTDLTEYPHAHDLRSGVLVYSAEVLASADRRAVQGELIRAFADGPGVVNGVWRSQVQSGFFSNGNMSCLAREHCESSFGFQNTICLHEYPLPGV